MTDDVIVGMNANVSEEIGIVEWKKSPVAKAGVMVGVVGMYEDLTEYWLRKIRRVYEGEIEFACFDVSITALRRFEKFGRVVPIKLSSKWGWLRKPFAILESSFSKILWMDNDVEVRRSVDEYFRMIDKGHLCVGWDSYNPRAFRRNLPEEAKLWDSGLVGLTHGDVVIEKWSEELNRRPFAFRGDHEALSLVIHERNCAFEEIPKTLHRMRLDPVADSVQRSELITFHWTGRVGKEKIRERLKRLRRMNAGAFEVSDRNNC